jgi:rRNA-processing protein FCF1
MISVILDTSALRREGITSVRMRQLLRLAARGEVRFVLPDLVEREFRSQREADIEKHLVDASHSLQAAARTLRGVDSASDELQTIASTIEEQSVSLVERDRTAWLTLIATGNVVRSPLPAGGYERAIADYFAGVGAFKSKKSREDLPDAFILECIRATAQEAPPLHLVSGDKQLREAGEGAGVHHVHESLETLLEHVDIAAAIARLDDEDNVRTTIVALMSASSRDAIATWLRSSDEAIESVYLEEEDITGLMLADMFVRQPSIGFSDAGSVDNVEVSGAIRSNEGTWVLNIRFNAECLLSFASTWEDFYSMGSDRALTLDSGDELVDVSEAWVAIHEGELQLIPAAPDDGGANVIRFDIAGAHRVELNVMQAILLRPVPTPRRDVRKEFYERMNGRLTIDRG